MANIPGAFEVYGMPRQSRKISACEGNIPLQSPVLCRYSKSEPKWFEHFQMSSKQKCLWPKVIFESVEFGV